jgi:hypothetical protein
MCLTVRADIRHRFCSAFCNLALAKCEQVPSNISHTTKVLSFSMPILCRP